MDTETTLPRAALDAGVDHANLIDPLVPLDDGRTRLLVPTGYRTEDVSNPHLLPPRIIQKVTFDDRDSLTGYVNRFSDGRTILIADLDAGTIAAHLDWHRPNDALDEALQAQANQHRATLHLRTSEEFARWDQMEGEMHSQEDFAAFIEENVADVAVPDHSDLLEICRELEATTGSTFKSGVRLDNGDRTFRYETETRVTNEISVPTEIMLSIPIWHGEMPCELRAKFRFRANGNGLQLGFRWHRVEYQRQATFRAMAHQVAEETGRPVYFGRP